MDCLPQIDYLHIIDDSASAIISIYNQTTEPKVNGGRRIRQIRRLPIIWDMRGLEADSVFDSPRKGRRSKALLQ